MKAKNLFVAGLCLFVISVTAQTKAKNVIFMIGDGMGINQIYAAMTANGGHLNLETCTTSGYSKTYSADNYITDSAAGGTALATGSKTKNGMIGLAPDSVTKLISALHYAKQKGLSTGLVVTVSVTHATPASFYAHQISRKMDEEIAIDLLKEQVDVVIGGGQKFFDRRKDSILLTNQFIEKGYHVVYTEKDINNVRSGKLLALLSETDLPVATKRGDMLPNSVEKAINLLSNNKDGFFLMVEGSQIDYQGHNNNSDELIAEMIDFDKAIGKALEFAKKDGNTLVVITADHETGALAILNGSYQTGVIDAKFNTTGHSGVPVPVFAYGPGSELFSGWMENIDFRNKVLKALGINP